MKNTLNRRDFLRFAGAGTACAVGALSIPAGAKASSPANLIAARVQSFYDQTTTLEATFSQNYYHALYRRTQRSRGRLRVAKPGRIRFDYARPNGKVIVSDGDALTLYQPGGGGEAGHHIVHPVEAASLPTALSFLTGQGRLESDYTFRLAPSNPRYPGDILVLHPRSPDPNIRRVILLVHNEDSLRGVVQRVRIDDHDGNRNLFLFRGMRFNRDVPASTFRWQPPAASRLMSA